MQVWSPTLWQGATDCLLQAVFVCRQESCKVANEENGFADELLFREASTCCVCPFADMALMVEV